MLQSNAGNRKKLVLEAFLVIIFCGLVSPMLLKRRNDGIQFIVSNIVVVFMYIMQMRQYAFFHSYEKNVLLFVFREA